MAVQWQWLCSGSGCAVAVAVQWQWLCSGSGCAVAVAVQWQRLCSDSGCAVAVAVCSVCAVSVQWLCTVAMQNWFCKTAL